MLDLVAYFNQAQIGYKLSINYDDEPYDGEVKPKRNRSNDPIINNEERIILAKLNRSEKEHREAVRKYGRKLKMKRTCNDCRALQYNQ